MDTEIQLKDKYFKQYLFDEKIDYMDRNREKTYDKFLYAMIPDVKTVVMNHIKNNEAVSIDKLIEAFEYLNIDYSQLYKTEYNELVYKVENNVLKYNKLINEHANQAKRFVRQNKRWKISKNNLFTMLNAKQNDVYQLYDLKETDAVSEIINKIYSLDNVGFGIRQFVIIYWICTRI